MRLITGKSYLATQEAYQIIISDTEKYNFRSTANK
tara:strand:- start:633 stop:737 length:105 start_codon:yes stop_codon:yes gene_type:complete